MEDSRSSKFVWVASSTSNSPSERSKQRRDVMQKVALRRQRKPKQRHPNSRQLPVFVGDDNTVTISGAQLLDESSRILSENLDSIASEPDELPSQTWLTCWKLDALYPSMLVKSNMDFLDLSSLASIEVGRYTGQRLIERPRSIALFLGGTTWSYWRYVPLHYAQSILVRTATDCVVARTRSLLEPEDKVWASLALTSYSKALSHLQKAINSTSQLPTAEILCATQILGIYELLNPHRENAWIKHAAGAASIIRLRGPSGYISDFEKSLFMSQIGPIVTESILENQSCFLEQPVWLGVLRSIITNDPLTPERSTKLNLLLNILVQIPRLFRDVTKAICDHSNTALPLLMELISRARNLRLALKSWHSNFIGPDDSQHLGTSLGDAYSKLRILFYLCSIYTNRLYTCICWKETFDIEEIEEETQRFANIIVSFCKDETHSNLQSSLILAQKLPIAEATIHTSEEWKYQWRLWHRSSKQGQLFKMPPQTFIHWCSLFGRKTS